jgi:hypothetical protein
VEPAVRVLERLLPVANAAGRVARRLALVAGMSAAVLIFTLFRDGIPEPAARAVVSALLAVLLLVPAAVLVAFWRACEEVLELPGRLRALPGAAAQRAAELGRVLRSGRTARARSAWRLLALTRSSRELLTPYAPLVALLSPAFLAATAVAALATAVEAAAALLALVLLAAA